MIFGIDLSLNSSGFCAYDEEENKYHFLANINLCAFSGKKVTPTLEELLADPIPVVPKKPKKNPKPPKPVKHNWLKELSELPDVTIEAHIRETGQGDDHVEIGHMRLRNIELLSNAWDSTLIRFMDKHSYQNITHIGIEDYSVAKITNAIVVVIEASAVFKQMFLLPHIDVENLFTIPGPKIKMLAGSGNFNKMEMLMAFVDIQDPVVRETPFHKFVLRNLKDLVKGKDVESPVNDMIDAFWVVKYTRDIILNKQEIPKKPKTKKLKI